MSSLSAGIESFPRMWDQLILEIFMNPPIRIIPTYVGSTRSGLIINVNCTNHSHVCGINSNWHVIYPAIHESFPRMWDQQMIIQIFHFLNRIIPTYVGSTCDRKRKTGLLPNHSHVCGINRFPRVRVVREFESFPRMWDQPVPSSAAGAGDRIIPTYVGSTISPTLFEL